MNPILKPFSYVAFFLCVVLTFICDVLRLKRAGQFFAALGGRALSE